jgi:hypothetical protein
MQLPHCSHGQTLHKAQHMATAQYVQHNGTIVFRGTVATKKRACMLKGGPFSENLKTRI